jgi:tRNA U38,U39,U40 pseudouridine synthase TruA
MARFKITLEYEGTRYSGWQAQKNARTVQGEIIGALREILNTDRFEFYGSGRTDAGVHALAQVAHLDASTMLARKPRAPSTPDMMRFRGATFTKYLAAGLRSANAPCGGLKTSSMQI